MKKLLIIPLALLMLLSAAIPTHANPYGLYGRGNCTYFTYECIEEFWGMTPPIQRSWNAWEWVRLIGYEQDGYEIIKVDYPQPGDIFILPATLDNYRGHCGFITTVGRNYTFEKGIPSETYYRVMESAMYPDQLFNHKLGACRYRVWYYWQSDFEDAVFIRCEKK